MLKLLIRRTVGQAVPEIPLSVGSKLELLSSLPKFNFRILPRTLTHCPRMHNIAVYNILAIILYNVHDRGAEGFALFSAFIHCLRTKTIRRRGRKSRFCRFPYLSLAGRSSDAGVKRPLQKHSKPSQKP